jgi:DNA invertase Pin-like site-specific DNA recombinase
MSSKPILPPNSVVWGYVRAKEFEHGQLQVAEFEEFCRTSQLIPGAIFSDIADAKFTALQNMLASVATHPPRPAAIVVTKFNRLSCNYQELERITDELREQNVIVYSIEDDRQPIDRVTFEKICQALQEWQDEQRRIELSLSRKKSRRNKVLSGQTSHR